MLLAEHQQDGDLQLSVPARGGAAPGRAPSARLNMLMNRLIRRGFPPMWLRISSHMVSSSAR